MELLDYAQYQDIARSLVFPSKAIIDGKETGSLSGRTFSSENPATGQKLAEITGCDEKDVDIAVQAARRSFQDGRWSKLKPSERKKILSRFADLILEHGNELAVMESLDSGKPIYDTAQVDVPETAECFKWHGEAADKLEDEITATDLDHVSMVVREPIGVVGAVLPWNFPLLMAGWKLAPILATGNSVVVKPSKLTSLTLLRIGQLALEAGIPEGVFNIVPGDGRSVGEAIARHPDVDMITFTGSTEVGRKLLEYSSQSNLKRVLLELGGKNPCLVFPDIHDLDRAAEQIVMAALWNMGENCTANSRILVHRDIKDKLTEKLIEKTSEWKTGNPLDRVNRLGAIIERPHMEKILQYIETGKAEGGRVIYGGKRILEETGGYFIEPTIFDGVTPYMTIAREEIFGPVFAVMTFDTAEEAVFIANDTQYGLQASLWSDDVNTVHRISRLLRAGTVSVNCYSEGDIGTPFGGFKQSGFFGRDKSLWANRQYTELKTIWMELKDMLI
jgi:gamma-glutamyl-gamma-aminobutyraldehyde dehydrogenase